MMVTMAIVMFLGISDSSLGEMWTLLQEASEMEEAQSSVSAQTQ